MNDITLDDEDESGLALDVGVKEANSEILNRIDVKLCLVGHFMVEGVIVFMGMKQALAALWRPG